MINDALIQKIQPIRLFITDVDGVLTDASMYYAENGNELKKFNTRDGGGLLLLQLVGIKTAIITSEDTNIVERRAKKLKFDFVFQGYKDKVRALEVLLQKNKLENHEVAFVGDDINDLSIMKRVGFSITVADATREIHKIADHILLSRGGEGAVREAAELILDGQGKYETAIQLYLNIRSK